MMPPTIDQMNEVICKFEGGERLRQWEAGMFLRYHTSWDCLMPVVEKISELDDGKYNFHISSAGQWACYIDRDDVFDSEICSYGGFEPTILNVFKAVYQFIQWYNQQKQL